MVSLEYEILGISQKKNITSIIQVSQFVVEEPSSFTLVRTCANVVEYMSLLLNR
jgi:hypothetical protein